MNFKTTIKQSPNVNQGRTIKPEGIVLHHTAGSYLGSVAWCLNPNAKVSYHCIVDLNGERTILVQDNQRAWHAGKSTFKGRSDCNNFMLGIAVSGDTNNRELTHEESISIAEWCVDKMKKHGFGLNEITTHREVSPNRKNDVDIRAYVRIMHEIREIFNLNC